METSLKLLTYSKPYYYIFIVCCGAILWGASMACTAIPVTKGMVKITYKHTTNEKWKSMWHTNIILASQICLLIFAQSISKFLLRWVTNKLSINLRSQTFRTLIKQPIEFFDSKLNSIGSLVGVLSSDIRDLNGASIEIYMLVLQGFAGIVGAIAVSFAYNWRIALIVLPVIPLFSIGFAVQFNLQFTPPNKTKTNSK